jgi:hypothetical protein
MYVYVYVYAQPALEKARLAREAEEAKAAEKARLAKVGPLLVEHACVCVCMYVCMYIYIYIYIYIYRYRYVCIWSVRSCDSVCSHLPNLINKTITYT